MPKRKKVSIPTRMLEKNLNTLNIQNVNLTTTDKKVYETGLSRLLSGEDRSNAKYGTGPLTFQGESTKDEAVFCGSNQLNKKTTYLIRGSSYEGSLRLNKLVNAEAAKLTGLKVSNTEAIGGFTLPNTENLEKLVSEAVASQVGLQKTKLRISSTSEGVLQIGSISTSKFIQIGVSKMESTPSRKCICIVSRVKETTPKFIEMMETRNLSLDDLYAFALRDSMESLNDCDLKFHVLNFIKSTFSIPSKERLKADKQVENSKVRYIRYAFNSALKHLNDPLLQKEVCNEIKKFIKKVPANCNPLVE